MFSIFALFACAGIAGYEAIKNSCTDTEWKERAKSKGDKIYVDHKGRWRSVETDELTVQNLDSYHGVDRHVGIKTGRVYWDAKKERTMKFIEERNKMLEEQGIPIYWKECKPYYNHKTHSMSHVHLYEKDTDRPFQYLCPTTIKKGVISVTDKDHFTIIYLDENNDMKPLFGEHRTDIPIEWELSYKLGM